MMRVCLFGGSFDPPHLGHLGIAEYIRDELQFDLILFIPAYIAPHKVKYRITSAEHRLEMLKLALKDRPGLELSDLEIRRRGISYSIDTILQIKKIMSLRSDDLYFLIGADSLLELQTWREPERILTESRLLVAARPDFSIDNIPENLRGRVKFLANPLLDISSTQIRQNIKNNHPVQQLVPDSVADYIARNRLYKN